MSHGSAGVAAAMSLAASAAAYKAAVLADNPWGAWLNDELSGSTLADYSGNGRDIDMANAYNLGAVGPIDYALELPSTGSGYGHTNVTHGPGVVTVETWVCPLATPTTNTWMAAHATGVGSGSHDKGIFIDTNGNFTFFVYYFGERYAVTVTPPALNTWHHVVASVGPAGLKMRINKVTTDLQPAITSADVGTQQAFFLRTGGNSTSWYGGINGGAPMRLWGTAVYDAQLSDAQTDAHFDVL